MSGIVIACSVITAGALAATAWFLRQSSKAMEEAGEKSARAVRLTLENLARYESRIHQSGGGEPSSHDAHQSGLSK